MKLLFKDATKIMMFLLVTIIIAGGTTSCKSKKKIAREKAATEYAKRVEQSKKDLNAMLTGTTSWSLDEQDERLNVIRSYNIDDEDVVDLISKVEAKLSMDKAEVQRQIEEERLRREEEKRRKAEVSKYDDINSKLSSIALAKSMDASNIQIKLLLNEFSEPDVPVLIIISKAGGFNDYDRPTTISKFLNYIKDKQQYKYSVVAVKRDGLGKIIELELIKK